MSKYIDIDEFVKEMNDRIYAAVSEGYAAGKRDAVRHGRWIEATDDGVMHECSVCGEWSCCRSPYCGECGASMDEVGE